jgi:hypothetical protein
LCPPRLLEGSAQSSAPGVVVFDEEPPAAHGYETRIHRELGQGAGNHVSRLAPRSGGPQIERELEPGRTLRIISPVDPTELSNRIAFGAGLGGQAFLDPVLPLSDPSLVFQTRGRLSMAPWFEHGFVLGLGDSGQLHGRGATRHEYHRAHLDFLGQFSAELRFQIFGLPLQ